MPSDFDLITTPDPTEFTIRIRVPDQIINKQLALQPSGKLKRYDKYKDVSFAVRHERVAEFGEYVYTYCEQADAGHKYLYFARARTDAERNTPFETFYGNRPYAWPAVLEDLYFVSSTFPQSTATGADSISTATRYFKRQKYRPTRNALSRIKVQQYLSEVPWPAQALVHPQPDPTEVDGSYLGIEVNFPKCLHPRIVLPELVPGAQIVFGAGAVNVARSGTPKEQVFPATNFEDWRSFIVDDSIQPQKGLWLREKVTIYPPPRLESIEN
jgi:hypothetical protein